MMHAYKPRIKLCDLSFESSEFDFDIYDPYFTSQESGSSMSYLNYNNSNDTSREIDINYSDCSKSDRSSSNSSSSGSNSSSS